jgi:hypothetical protein
MKKGHDMVIASCYLGGVTNNDDDFVARSGNRLFWQAICLPIILKVP